MMELNSRHKQIIKESIKTRIACLNWSKACMESSFKIGLGSLSDLHRCIRDIEESKQLLIDLEETEVNNGQEHDYLAKRNPLSNRSGRNI